MENEKKTISVRELNKLQLTRAKRLYWNERKIKEGSGATFAEFEMIDDLVSDDEIFKAYEHIQFDEDAFTW